MTAKGKLIRNSIIAVVSVGILGAGYYFAVKWEPKEEEKEVSTQSSELIKLFSTETENIKSVTIQNLKEKYTLVQDEEGNVSIPEKAGIEFKQMSLQSAISSFATINGSKEITKDMSRLAEFGLDSKDMMLTVTLKDGESKAFIIGDNLPGSDDYYFMEDGGDTVYTLSSYKMSSFLKVPDDYREKQLFSIENIMVRNIVVEKGNEVLLSMRPPTDNDVVVNTIGPNWIMEKPCPGEGATDDRVTEFLNNFMTVNVMEFADDNPSDLNKYGLGTDAYTLTLKTDEKTHKLRLGKATEDGNGVYIQYNDNKSVMVSDVSMLNCLMNLDPMDYVAKLVNLVNIEDVATVKIEKDSKIYTMEVGEGDEEENPDKYKINGQSTKADSFKDVYQQVIGVAFVDYGDFQPKEQFMTVTYSMKNGEEIVIKYYEYNERYYLAERTGKRMTVLKTDMSDLFFTLDNAN